MAAHPQWDLWESFIPSTLFWRSKALPKSSDFLLRMTLGFTKSGIERAVRHGGKAVDFAFKVAKWVLPLTLQTKNKSYEKTNFQAWAIPWNIFNICSPLCSGSTHAGVLTSVIWLISSSFSYVLQHSSFILLLKLIHSFYGNSTVDLVR